MPTNAGGGGHSLHLLHEQQILLLFLGDMSCLRMTVNERKREQQSTCSRPAEAAVSAARGGGREEERRPGWAGRAGPGRAGRAGVSGARGRAGAGPGRAGSRLRLAREPPRGLALPRWLLAGSLARSHARLAPGRQLQPPAARTHLHFLNEPLDGCGRGEGGGGVGARAGPGRTGPGAGTAPSTSSYPGARRPPTATPGWARRQGSERASSARGELSGGARRARATPGHLTLRGRVQVWTPGAPVRASLSLPLVIFYAGRLWVRAKRRGGFKRFERKNHWMKVGIEISKRSIAEGTPSPRASLTCLQL
ncbi:spidroin-2-like [Cavia porcellus]|uniref:spidroin-2-like n=1 Tax=Cavia porcellus TaxID=10141 RepID=UPI002FE34A5B